MSSSVASVSDVSLAGHGLDPDAACPAGGIAPVRSLRTTSSHTDAWSRTEPREMTSSASPPVLVFSL